MSLSSVQVEDIFALTERSGSSLNATTPSLPWECFQNDSLEKNIASSINTLLSSEKTRQQGLIRLNTILDNKAINISPENALVWVNHCIVKYSEDNLRETKLTTIRKIVENKYSEHEFTKKFLSEYVSKVLDNCLLTTHINSFTCEAALKTLAACLKYYGSWFGHHKTRIEEFLITFLDNDNESLVKTASVAFHYLQQVGGAGSDGMQHRNSFSKSFHRLCATVHKLLDELLKNEHEIGNYNRSGEESYKFNMTVVDSYKLKDVLCKRIRNCAEFLITMIRLPFPAAKDTKPKRLLDIILRGISIHHCLTSGIEIKTESLQNFLTLNNVQEKLMRLLQWTIIWYKTNILPFSFVISKLLLDCLKRSHSCGCYRTNCIYIEIVYKTLNEWLKVNKNCVHIHFQNQFLTYILEDITPVKTQVTLTVPEDNNKAVSKKARKKALQEKIISSGKSNIEASINPQENTKDNIRKLALCSLKTYFRNVCIKAETRLIQQIYSVVLTSLKDIQSESNFYNRQQNVDCETGLYEVLVSFYEQNSISVHPPLELSLEMLRYGLCSTNRFVSNTCQKGLFALEKLCQPVCPSLYLNTRTREDSEIETEEKEFRAVDVDSIAEGTSDFPHYQTTTYYDESGYIDDIKCGQSSPTKVFDEPGLATLNDENSQEHSERQYNEATYIHELEYLNCNEIPQGGIPLRNVSSEEVLVVNDEISNLDTSEINDDSKTCKAKDQKVITILDQTIIRNGETITENGVHNGEPPSKKSKVEDLTESTENIETISLDDDFVDEVKDY